MRFRSCILIIVLLLSSEIRAQSSFKLVTWNLLNWPIISAAVSDSSSRCPNFRTVMQYLDADIIVTQENSASYSTTWFLNCALNYNSNAYRQGSFINGFDTNNGIFYKDSLFTFISNTRTQTDVRDINEFKLVLKSSGDTLRIFSLHLKAGSGQPYENQRLLEVDSLRSVTGRLSPGSYFIACGDFNIYGTFEQAYQRLVEDLPGDDGHLIDPLFMPGIWNQSFYRQYHTQSTRSNSFGGGAGGGLDDRFDMILYSESMIGPNGIYYVPGSLTSVGNDGNHYNLSVNANVNLAVPAAVANALYAASDHLPVMATFEVGPVPFVAEIAGNVRLKIYPNPNSGSFAMELDRLKAHEYKICIRTVEGQLIWESTVTNTGEPEIIRPYFENELMPGLYLVSVESPNSFLSSKILVFR